MIVAGHFVGTGAISAITNGSQVMVRFIENPIYNEANDISSVLCASYLLKNAYVMSREGIRKYHSDSTWQIFDIRKY